MSLSSLTCLIGIGGCKSGLLHTDRIVGAPKKKTCDDFEHQFQVEGLEIERRFIYI
jgi:hypothetical protein